MTNWHLAQCVSLCQTLCALSKVPVRKKRRPLLPSRGDGADCLGFGSTQAAGAGPPEHLQIAFGVGGGHSQRSG